jgi:hypothetical protein
MRRKTKGLGSLEANSKQSSLVMEFVATGERTISDVIQYIRISARIIIGTITDMSTRKDLQQPVRKSLENDVAAIPG